VLVQLEPEPMELGLLDTIDDFGHVRAAKTSPSMRPAPGPARSGIDLFQHGATEAPRGPLPNGAARPHAGAPNAANRDDDVGHKLEQLKELLSDPRLRHILDASRMPETH
jgi:hypothetical protein